MTDQTVNIPLLRKAVEWAEGEAAKPRELSEWEQGYWMLSVQTRVEAAANAERFGHGLLPEFVKAPECGTCYCIAGYVAHSAGLDGAPRREARDLLGLSRQQAENLFDAYNTIEDVRRIAESIAGERL